MCITVAAITYLHLELPAILRIAEQNRMKIPIENIILRTYLNEATRRCCRRQNVFQSKTDEPVLKRRK